MSGQTGDKIRETELERAIEKGEAAERTIIRVTSELRERNRELAKTNDEIIEMLGDVVELRNEESGMHIQRVKAFTRVLAKIVQETLPEYGLTDDDVELITSASALHDVGKIMIPDAILLKPGRLTPEEFEIMKSHSEKGCLVLKRAPKTWSARYLNIGLEIVRHHHEKWDGRGYPDGLKGDEIPISAQLVSVADCFDALTTERVYKPAFSVDKAFDMILGGECGAFSEKLMNCFRQCREIFAELAEHPERADVVVSTSVYGSEKLRGVRVLLVDDNDLTREINREVLEREGASVTEESSGQGAIDRIAGGDQPDVILMDIVMPEMDGITATRRIREAETEGRNRLTIISLTSEGSDAQVEECLKAGADDCMGKPLLVAEFSRILAALRKKREAQAKVTRLEETARSARTDTLTQAKNIVAFADQAAELTGRMAGSAPTEYAVVFCALENTREINSAFGMEAGDQYIRNAYSIIAGVFDHSPVYRIGGDEFLAVLQEADYKNRELLIRMLRDKVLAAKDRETAAEGLVSMRAGMAVYAPETDATLAEVIRRAMSEADKGREA